MINPLSGPIEANLKAKLGIRSFEPTYLAGTLKLIFLVSAKLKTHR
jgi:hypothetical protein